MNKTIKMIKFKTIQLERGVCFSSCPVYKMTIHSDGRVIFFGKHFTNKNGHHEWRIGKDKIDALNLLLQEFNFYHYKFDPKDDLSLDNPMVTTSVEFTTGFKKVINHVRSSREESGNLAKFEDKIDFLSGNQEYSRNDEY